MRNQIQHRLFLIILIWLYFGSAVWMTFHLPGLATPNELLNYEYIQVMRQIGELPNRSLVDSEVRYTEWHQPPVYFTFAALVGLAIPVAPSPINPPPVIDIESNPFFTSTHEGNRNPALHITPHTFPLLYTSRLAAALLGVVALAALYRAGSRLYTPAIGLLMVSLLAFQPNFIHLSSSVNNDMPLTAVSTIVLAYAILLIAADKGAKAYLGLGLLCALSVLTKANGIFVLTYVGMACLIKLWRHRQLWVAIQCGLLSIAGFMPLWGGWLILNTIRLKDTLALSGSFPVSRVLLTEPRYYWQLRAYLPEIWRSFWLDWSAGRIGYAPTWVYVVSGLLLLIGLLGWLYRRPTRQPWYIPLTVFAGVIAISYLYFAVKAATLTGAPFIVPEGRWWLPVMPGLAWLVAVGFARWWPAHWQTAVCVGAALAPPLLLIGLLVWYLPTLYPQAKPLPTATTVFGDVQLLYNGELQLLGATAPPMTVGQPATAQLYWSSLTDLDTDYVVSVQLLATSDNGWMKLEEQNTHPGYGLNPTSTWQAGEIYQDAITLIPQGNLNGPTQAALAVWTLTEEGRVTPLYDGQPTTLAFADDTVIRPVHLAPNNPMPDPVSFGDLFNLTQVELSLNDSDFTLILWWQATTSPLIDYHIFTHLFDATGQLMAQQDGIPNNALSPTRIWQTDDVIRDQYHFDMPFPEQGSLLIGAYDPLSGVRLTAVQAGQPLANNAYRFMP